MSIGAEFGQYIFQTQFKKYWRRNEGFQPPNLPGYASESHLDILTISPHTGSPVHTHDVFKFKLNWHVPFSPFTDYW